MGETDTGFWLAKRCRSHSLDGHYDTFSSEHVLYTGLDVEQAFDIAKGVDEGSNTKTVTINALDFYFHLTWNEGDWLQFVCKLLMLVSLHSYSSPKVIERF